jgi:triacylglycerol lipase
MSDPIVLVHGIFGFGQLMVGGTTIASYFRGIPEALRQDNYIVPDPPQLNTAGSVSDRANDLRSYLNNPSNVDVVGKRVHIVAHSMGGLDSRFMISQLGLADRVLSLTTIGTPHHGSPIADLVIQDRDPRLVALLGSLGVTGIGDLTTTRCAEFNRLIPEARQVRYYSVAGHFDPPRPLGVPLGLLGLTHDLIQAQEGDNDGLVSVTSATAGNDAHRWTFLGNWEANHFRLVNWGTDIVPTPAELRDSTILEVYRSIVARVVLDQAVEQE